MSWGCFRGLRWDRVETLWEGSGPGGTELGGGGGDGEGMAKGDVRDGRCNTVSENWHNSATFPYLTLMRGPVPV